MSIYSDLEIVLKELRSDIIFSPCLVLHVYL